MRNANTARKSFFRRRFSAGGTVIFALLVLLALFCLYPLYNVLVVSLTTYKDASLSGFYLFPRHINFDSYKVLFADRTIPDGFLVTLFVTLVGTLYNMFLSITMGYALSRKHYPGRKFFQYYMIITMLFTGGLIPLYLVVFNLNLIDSLFSMILPVGINTFYMILLENYFSNIPESIIEAAKIDGANDIVILTKVVLPVSAPILATVVLFYAVDRWNEYYNGLLYIREPNLQPIQLILRNMLVNMESSVSGNMGSMLLKTTTYSQGIRMAVVMVTALPILLVYPFLQKYFTKGIMLGSIKA